ncbi:hypothetical protein [Thiocystis violacea]|nr:hypothetical protein [Thiocystis violacea]
MPGFGFKIVDRLESQIAPIINNYDLVLAALGDLRAERSPG